MKILYHHRTQSEDAQGVHIHEMVKAFVDLGHDVCVVSPAMGGTTEKKNILGSILGWLARKVPLWVYELMGIVYNFYGFWLLCRTIRREGPDLIYERYSLNSFCGMWASKRYRIPIVLEVNAPLFREQSDLNRLFFKRFAQFSERWICSRSTWTIVVSSVMRGILIKEGIPEKSLVVMHNGIDPSKFHLDVSGKTVRQRYSLSGKIVIGFIGWFRPWHGIEMLLEVFYKENLADKGVSLLLVGDGPAYPQLYKYAQEKELLGAVKFTGAVKSEEIPEHIAAMDIAVQPSATIYACPMKILEYMGMAKCIVAPRQDNIEELLTHEETGFLFQADDQESLGRALLGLLENPEKKDVIGKNAYLSIYKRGLTWEDNAKRVVALGVGETSTY